MRCFRLGRPQLVWGTFIAMSFVACSVIELPPAAPQEGTAQPTILEEPGDSLVSTTGKKDTVYHHREVTLYRDTVERVNEIQGTSYRSFVYKNSSGVLDTVTRDSNALKCNMGEESFSCEYFAQYIVENPIYGPPLIIYKDSIRPLDTTKVHIYVVDTVYKEHAFTTHDGDEIMVPGKGYYGYRIEKTKEEDQLWEELDENEQVEREPVYRRTEAASPDGKWSWRRT